MLVYFLKLFSNIASKSFFICIFDINNNEMSSKSNDYLDVKVWIENVINSCETYPQTLVAGKLIELFYRQMKRNHIDTSTVWDIEHKLKYRLFYVQQQITTKINP